MVAVGLNDDTLLTFLIGTAGTDAAMPAVAVNRAHTEYVIHEEPDQAEKKHNENGKNWSARARTKMLQARQLSTSSLHTGFTSASDRRIVIVANVRISCAPTTGTGFAVGSSSTAADGTKTEVLQNWLYKNHGVPGQAASRASKENIGPTMLRIR